MTLQRGTLRNVQRAGICGLILAGMSLEKAVVMVGTSIKTAKRGLPECWHTRTPHAAPYRPDAWHVHFAEVKRLRELGVTNAEIGRAIGRSPWWASQIAKLGGLPMRTAGRRSQGVRQ